LRVLPVPAETPFTCTVPARRTALHRPPVLLAPVLLF